MPPKRTSPHQPILSTKRPKVAIIPDPESSYSEHEGPREEDEAYANGHTDDERGMLSDDEGDIVVEAPDAATQKAQRKNKKASPSEAYRLAHFPDIPRKPGGMGRKLDIHDPASFRVMEIGDADESTWRLGSKEDHKAGRKRLKQNLHRIVEAYKQRAETYVTGLDSVVAGTQSHRNSMLDVVQEVREILASMKKNTSGALGTKVFDLKDTDSMGAFTAEDLKAWIVYAGWLLYKSGKIDAYVGSSIPKEGGGKRLIGCYEDALQDLEEGWFKSALSQAGLAMHAADPEVLRIIVRPICVSVPPTDAVERRILGQAMRRREGVFMDYLQVIKEGNGVLQIAGREIDRSAMASFSRSLAPLDRVQEYGRLNSCHALTVGYDRQLSRAIQRALAEAEKQGWICPIDGWDLRVPSNGRLFRGKNPLQGKVPGCDAGALCGACANWIGQGNALAKALECPDLDAVQKLRQTGHAQWRAPHDLAFKHCEDDCCPLCDEAYEERLEGETRDQATRRTKLVRADLPPKIKPWKCMENITVVCFGCKAILQRFANPIPESEGVKLAQKEIQAGCSLDRLREILAARSARAGKGKRKSRAVRDRQDQKAEQCNDAECALCDVEFLELPLGQSRDEAAARGDVIKCSVPARVATWKCMASVKAICAPCSKTLIRFAEAKVSGPMYKIKEEVKEGCSFARLREIIACQGR
ncbi:hypothetical protein LTR10_002336 [Elasticomyces elasticus]|nr:hypothetical protein LTR10_002336 [Elasticomyces elasticus]KAK4973594.1 hypothetical protein LTR42_005583 [Elasticomyces elasticus]